MTESYEWTAARDDAVARFNGELPHAETEAAIIEVFEQRPVVVLRAIQEVGESVSRGQARSGWAVLKARLQGALEPLREATVEGNDRELAVRKAGRWLANAGLYCDREEEVVDALYGLGDEAYLAPFSGDEKLREDLLILWREHRLVGSQVEAEADARIKRQVEALRRVASGEVVRKREPEVVETPAQDVTAPAEAGAVEGWSAG